MPEMKISTLENNTYGPSQIPQGDSLYIIVIPSLHEGSMLWVMSMAYFCIAIDADFFMEDWEIQP